MSWIKYIPWLVLVLAIGTVAFYQWRSAEATRELLKIRTAELTQSNLELGRANTKIAEQDKLNKVALENIDKKWKDEIKKRQALVSLFAQLQANYEAEKKKVKVLTKIIYKDKEVLVDLPKGKLFIRQDDGTYKEILSMSYKYNDFRIDIEGDMLDQTISYKLHQRFRAQFVESVLPNGVRNHYAKIYELDNENKDVGEMKLIKFDVLRSDENRNHMMWWNPKIDLGIGLGMNHKINFGWSADLGISFMAYGRTKDDITWRFLRLSGGLTPNGFGVSLSPALYNLGKALPLISNCWLYPYGGYDFGSQAAHFGLGIAVVF